MGGTEAASGRCPNPTLSQLPPTRGRRGKRRCWAPGTLGRVGVGAGEPAARLTKFAALSAEKPPAAPGIRGRNSIHKVEAALNLKSGGLGFGVII